MWGRKGNRDGEAEESSRCLSRLSLSSVVAAVRVENTSLDETTRRNNRRVLTIGRKQAEILMVEYERYVFASSVCVFYGLEAM